MWIFFLKKIRALNPLNANSIGYITDLGKNTDKMTDFNMNKNQMYEMFYLLSQSWLNQTLVKLVVFVHDYYLSSIRLPDPHTPKTNNQKHTSPQLQNA